MVLELPHLVLPGKFSQVFGHAKFIPAAYAAGQSARTVTNPEPVAEPNIDRSALRSSEPKVKLKNYSLRRAITHLSLGSDLMLLTLAREAFLNAGWRTEVEIGRYTYPVPPDGLTNRTFRQSALR